MPVLRYTGAALDDLADIAAHIIVSGGSRETALRFTAELRARCRHLAALPGTLGRARPELLPHIRSFAFGNHVIFFRYEGEVFEVVNILDGHRDLPAHFRAEEGRGR